MHIVMRAQCSKKFSSSTALLTTAQRPLAYDESCDVLGRFVKLDTRGSAVKQRRVAGVRDDVHCARPERQRRLREIRANRNPTGTGASTVHSQS